MRLSHLGKTFTGKFTNMPNNKDSLEWIVAICIPTAPWTFSVASAAC